MEDADVAMFHEIMEEVRHIRKRLDDHIDDEKDQLNSLQKDVSKIREEMQGHKTRLGMIASGLAMFVAAVISWIMSHLGWDK